MNTWLKNTRLRLGRLLFLLLLTPIAPMAFTACDNPEPEITITMESDYRQIIQALNDVNKSLTQKLTLIESAISDGFADSQAQQALIQKALESLTGTMSEKLSAIETAIKSQTASLETKLALIEAAVANGFADQKAQESLIQTALESLTGTVAERLKAIETAVQNESLSIGTKLELISSSIESELADSQAALGLIRQAIESLDGRVEEKLAAIETAVSNQTTGLETKLAAIEAAVASGFADAQAGQALLQQAVESLGGTVEEKLAAIEAAVSGQTSSLETKLGLIEAAVTTGLADVEAGQELIQKAIASLGSDLSAQLASLRSAVTSQTTSLESKLALIEQAVKDGMADSETSHELIKQAIESLSGTMSEKLAAIETAVKDQNTSLDTKLTAIETAVKEGFVGEAGALGLIQTAVNSLKTSVDGDAGLIEKVGEIVSKLGTIDTTLNGNVTTALTGILGAIAGLKDYSDILTAIKEAIEKLGGGDNPEEPFTETFVWTGSEEVDGWAGITLGDDRFIWNTLGLKDGDVIKVYYTAPEEGWWELQLCNGHWGTLELAELDGGNEIKQDDGFPGGSQSFSFNVTEAIVASLTEDVGWGGAMVINGYGKVEVTALSLIQFGSAKKYLWQGDIGPTNWDGDVIPTGVVDLDTLEPGMTMGFEFYVEDGEEVGQVEFMGGWWDQLPSLMYPDGTRHIYDFQPAETYIEFVLTAEDINIIQAEGFLFVGNGGLHITGIYLL